MTDPEKMEGIGYIAQVMHPDGTWLSWTQFTTGNARESATTLAVRLLENERYDFIAARVVRADWVVIENIDRGPAATEPEAPQANGGA